MPGRSSSLLATGPRRVLAGLCLVALVAATAGWSIPRGPVTTTQAVSWLGVLVAVGWLSGWLARTRWLIPAGPAVFALTFELARIRVDGPTVDGISLSGIYGVIALLGGRGIDALLLLLPLAVGTGWGVWWARGRERRAAGQERPRRIAGTAGLVLASIVVTALVAGLLRPASTALIKTDGGKVLPGSIAELVDVPIGGHDQAIMLRGVSTAAPILLFLEGGPGGTAIGRIRNSGEALERDFIVAVWDQRGAGKSYDALEPTETLTLESMVDDTVEVTRYLLDRFGQQRLYLVGSSWGTIIGTLAAQRHPELFHAWVGTGQMVDPFETDQLMYAETLADARSSGDDAFVGKLEALGPPPYRNTLDYPTAISSNPKWMQFEHGADHRSSSEYPASLFVGEYALIEQLRGMAAIAETFHVLYPQLEGTDFRVDVPSLSVPVYLVEGRHEAAGRSVLARQWFDGLRAPSKQWVEFDMSGHTPPYDEPGRFAELMRQISHAG